MSIETDRICDIPPNAVDSWVDKFFSEDWSVPGIKNKLAFLETDCSDAKDELSRSGVSSDSREFRKIDQILDRVRRRAQHRFQMVSNLKAVDSRVRQLLNQKHG